ncbi:MAG: 30S ribosomal protein S9 [Candidatus Thermoplasmatota archaeon]|jgi:small subunit ribosomal protein S9|nr:30S ribosomal protein S9 [Candidatus Thermoplasmatota archaeon]MCL5984747.1 30S ribosomal protein S9 [Candidatus Thermoplasmatota archaeon]
MPAANTTIQTSGKRKAAVARAVITKGSGRVWVNSRPIEVWEPYEARLKMQEPILISGARAEGLDISITVTGGGYMGQASAVRTAIARGLIEAFRDNELASVFKHYDRSLLVNDTRRKLPKTPQGRGARKRRQKSYR